MSAMGFIPSWGRTRAGIPGFYIFYCKAFSFPYELLASKMCFILLLMLLLSLNIYQKILKLMKVYKTHSKEVIGCIVEGHIGNVLSARLSSRPMGWSPDTGNEGKRH